MPTFAFIFVFPLSHPEPAANLLSLVASSPALRSRFCTPKIFFFVSSMPAPSDDEPVARQLGAQQALRRTQRPGWHAQTQGRLLGSAR